MPLEKVGRSNDEDIQKQLHAEMQWKPIAA
jgi:hypothetical protein